MGRFDSWRAKAHKVRLPSGLEAEMRKPDMLELMLEDGNVPDSLLDAAMTGNQQSAFVMEGESHMRDSGNDGSLISMMRDKEQARLLVELRNRAVLAAMVAPRVVLADADYEETVLLSDIEFQDKMFIMSWAMGGGDQQFAQAQTFLAPVQVAGVDAAQGSEGIRNQTE